MSVFASLPDQELEEATLRRLRRLVELESPSSDPVRLRALAGELAASLAGLGAEVDTVESEAGEHLVARLTGSDPLLEPILLLAHMDTVHAVGSFDPVFQVADGRASGPGTFDMKGGIACMLEAIARLRQAGSQPRRPVVVLITCDEEAGSGTSRQLIEDVAGGVHAVLVPEPPLPGGQAKTRRKGVSIYQIEVEGRASHAGLAPEKGVNAIVELAHQVLAITAMADPAAGTTTSVGVVGGGTISNVVPERAWAHVDVRFTSAAESGRVDRAMRSLRPVLQGTAVAVEGGVNRPPMELTVAGVDLYEEARAIAAAEGWELGQGLAGGASDGSFTAGMGVPTLDGIGPDGAGAHAAHEHVLIADLPRRVRLYSRLLEIL